MYIDPDKRIRPPRDIHRTLEQRDGEGPRDHPDIVHVVPRRGPRPEEPVIVVLQRIESRRADERVPDEADSVLREIEYAPDGRKVERRRDVCGLPALCHDLPQRVPLLPVAFGVRFIDGGDRRVPVDRLACECLHLVGPEPVDPSLFVGDGLPDDPDRGVLRSDDDLREYDLRRAHSLIVPHLPVQPERHRVGGVSQHREEDPALPGRERDRVLPPDVRDSPT